MRIRQTLAAAVVLTGLATTVAVLPATAGVMKPHDFNYGHNGNIGMNMTWDPGSGYVSAIGGFQANQPWADPWAGHIHIYDTANGYSVNSPYESAPGPGLDVTPDMDFPLGSLVCVEGWAGSHDPYTFEGRPCLPVT
jgi:hypothetical protein